MADSPIIAPWPPDRRAAGRASDAKLMAAKVALSTIASAIEQTHWSRRDRLEYIQAICEKALRRLK